MLIKGKNIKLKTFDIIVVFAFVFICLCLFFVLFRKQSNISVIVKVNEESLAYANGGVPNWYVQFLHVGMKELDVFGRSTAEIKEIKTYFTSNQKSVVHLTIDLKAVYSLSNRQYMYKGKSVSIGSTIQLPLDNLSIKGMIIDIDGSKKNNLKRLFVQARIISTDPVFPQTEGVSSYIAEAIKEGDVMKDSLGHPVVKIIKKIEEDAKMTVITANGDVILQKHPMRKDVSLNLEILGEKIGGRYYLFGDTDFPIIVSNSTTIVNNNSMIEGLPFYTNNSLIWLTVTKINVIQ